MKIIFFLLTGCLLLSSNGLFSQEVYLDWAGQITRCGEPRLETYRMGLDKARNLYLAGNFEYTMDADPGPGEYNITSITPTIDIYISKLDIQGKLVWAKNFGGPRADLLSDLAVDDAGNFFCVGNFRDTTDFDPDNGITNLYGGDGSGYITKFDIDGKLQWAIKTASQSAKSIALDGSGNIYVAGSFEVNEDLDPGPGVVTTREYSIDHGCVRKFDKDGKLIWAKIFLSTIYYNRPQTIKLDKNGNCYVAGFFSGPCDFDPGPGTLVYTPGGFQAYFVVKLDADGNLKWAKDNIGYSIAVDDNENLYDYDSNISKYDKDGNLLWKKFTGGFPATEGYGDNIKTLTLDSAGNIYTCGSFQGTSDFDPGPGVYNMTVEPAADLNDGFVSKLDSDGNFIWAKQLTTYYRDIFYGIVTDNYGGVYTTGIYNAGTADFDPGPGVYNLSSQYGANFIWKLSPCPGNTDSTFIVNTCRPYTLNGTRYDTSGTYYQLIPNSKNCDSIITLKLIIKNNITDTFITACKSFTWNGNTYTNTGLFADTLQAANGCDSIVRLHLAIKQVSFSNIVTAVCKGQSVDGHTTSGTYVDTLIAANGCDSIRTLILLVTQPVFTSDSAIICEGQSYGGHNTSGIFTDSLKAINGCDSIRTLKLVVNPKKSNSINKVICKGESFQGHTVSGTYIDSLQTFRGCDSIVTLTLLVNELPAPSLGADRNICAGQVLTLNPGTFRNYVWQDGSSASSFIVNRIGTYFVKVTDINNCFAADTIRITKADTIPSGFLPPDDKVCPNGTIDVSVKNYSNYLWSTGSSADHISISSPGTYTLLVKDLNGCSGTDSIIVAANTDCIPISIPSAFTPNDDGRNDVFRPIIKQTVKNYQMAIYNRYGEKIFETTNIQTGWDGKYKGKAQNAGAYVYQIFYKQNNDVITERKGAVLLIK